MMMVVFLLAVAILLAVVLFLALLFLTLPLVVVVVLLFYVTPSITPFVRWPRRRVTFMVMAVVVLVVFVFR